MDQINLNLGCGPFPKQGWINTDRKSWNCPEISIFDLSNNKWPWENVSRIYLAHVLSQQQDFECEHILKHCFDALAPGGVLRVCEMDATTLFNFYFVSDGTHVKLNSEYERKRDLDDIRRTGKIFRSALHQFWFDLHRWERKFIFDQETLFAFVQAAGFLPANIRTQRVGFSDDAVFCGMETQATPQFIFEATKHEEQSE